MNYFNTRKDYYLAEIAEGLYTTLIEEKEKMTKGECEKKLEIFNFVLFGESFEVKQSGAGGGGGDDDDDTG